MKIKKILSLLLVVCIICCTNTLTIRAEDDVTVLINGEKIPGVIIDGTTLISLRWASLYMGYDISYEQETMTVNVISSSKAVTMQIGNHNISVYNINKDENGNKYSELEKVVTSDVPPQFINGYTTYIPLRAMAEAFDAEVDWDSETKTVTISVESASQDDMILYDIWGSNKLVISGNGEINIDELFNYFNDDITSVSIGTVEGIAGMLVTSDAEITIPKSAFSLWENLTSAYLAIVTSIGDFAFSGCSNLESVTFTDHLTNIGEYAFSSCYSLKKLTIPDSVTAIGEAAFFECTGLTEADMHESALKTIEDSTFSNCSNLTSVSLPNSLTNIKEFAFGDCKSLTEISLPQNLTNIDGFAFSGCSSLTEITIPKALTNIGEFAFGDCSSLSEVTILSSSISNIDETAFILCDSLKTVNCIKGSAADNPNLYPEGVEIVYI